MQCLQPPDQSTVVACELCLQRSVPSLWSVYVRNTLRVTQNSLEYWQVWSLWFASLLVMVASRSELQETMC